MGQSTQGQMCHPRNVCTATNPMLSPSHQACLERRGEATSTADASYVSRLNGSHFILYHYSLCTCQCASTGLQKDPGGGGD